MKKNSGFTALELAITAAIFSILAVIAIPSMISWRKNTAYTGAVNTLRSDLAVAKQAAIKNNANVVAQFTSRGYVIFLDNGEGGGKVKSAIQDGEEKTIRERTLPADVKITIIAFPGTEALKHKAVFNAKGLHPSGAGSLVMTGGKKSTKITVNVSGKISATAF